MSAEMKFYLVSLLGVLGIRSIIYPRAPPNLEIRPWICVRIVHKKYVNMSTTYEKKRKCDICKKPIPDDFVNSLCIECYIQLEKEQEAAKKLAQEEEEANKSQKQKEMERAERETIKPVHGIKTPDYKENPEQKDKPQWEANITQFAKTGQILYKASRQMYTFLKDYFIEKNKKHPQFPKYIWKPTVVDVGCGCGVGSNIMSQEADFVWGIDKNKKSIDFARECFTRVKNGIYYCPQVTFDHIDILQDTREFMKFDVVVAIEIIEHIFDYKKFLKTIIDKFKKEETEWFISTPNRNHSHIRERGPYNKYHVREWKSEEYYDVLSEFFNDIKFLKADGIPVDISTNHTPIIAHCKNPK